ncbi:MAG: HD domain-containing protein [Bradymonadaceae bacterium]|nr:HD domain-containing protein [Lujinxingiaceae bacterium]
MQRLFKAFHDAGKELFLVGGAVRDLALGKSLEELDDLDFCTNARPQESLQIIKGARLTHYEVGIEFGTVGAVLQGSRAEGFPKDCQVTTYRSEEYYRRGSRHPVVKYGDTIEQDLGRRDFSINSMALDVDGNFIDPYGGLDDLRNGILRVVGDPRETLAEDPLRILRIGRFISRLGFKVDESLRLAAFERADHILDISRERWLQEMNKMLRGQHVARALRFLHEVRLLGILLPEVASLVGLHESSAVHHKDVWEHTLQVIEQAPEREALRWAALLHDVGKAWTRVVHDDASVTFYRHEQQGAMLFEGIAKRFAFDNAMAKEVGFIIRHHGRAPQYESGWSDAAVRRLVRELDPFVESLLEFARADLTTRIDDKRKEALAKIEQLTERIESLAARDDLRPVLPSGIGAALMASLGLKAGPRVGELKCVLEEHIIEGLIESGREAGYYIDYLKANASELLSD